MIYLKYCRYGVKQQQTDIVLSTVYSSYSPAFSSAGSVCSRQVYQSEYRIELVRYPCWESVRCGDCGAACRRVGKLCYKQT